MTRIRTTTGLGAAALTLGIFSIALAQQGQTSKGAQPSNPTPAPSNSSPRPATSGQPNQAPGQPALQDPNSNLRNPTLQNPSQRWNRPFAFQNPQDEARFTQNTTRLARLEERLGQSNQDLLRRLGEIRQMSPDKQNAATMDLLQQMLQNQTQLQEYLVQSRMGWSGDLAPAESPTTMPGAPFGSVPTGAGQPGTAVSPDRP